jgi:hypothetical protein
MHYLTLCRKDFMLMRLKVLLLLLLLCTELLDYEVSDTLLVVCWYDDLSSVVLFCQSKQL